MLGFPSLFIDKRSAARRKAARPIRSERRQTGERRKTALGVIIKTSLPAEDIENWLETKCRGKWNLSLDGLDDALAAKSFRILFEEADDKARFTKAFTG